MEILLSNSCLVLPAVVKQQQEVISRNHVPSLFAVTLDPIQMYTGNISTMSIFSLLVSNPLALLPQTTGADCEEGTRMEQWKLGRIETNRVISHVQALSFCSSKA